MVEEVDGELAGAEGLVCTLLGPVHATLDGRALALGPPQRRAVLVPLLLSAGRVCSSEQIIDAVWGPTPPDKAPAAVQAHVSVLRRVLEPNRAPRQPSQVIQSVGRGYLIGVQDISVDLFLFRHRVTQAGKARTQGRVEAAAHTLRSALDLWQGSWQGSALLDVPGPFAEAHRDRLADERLSAFEDLIDLELAADPGVAVAHDLGELLDAHPHRERLHSLNMRLLHRDGRRGDALAAYVTARRRLAEDLGIDPGPELQALHRTILADDPMPVPPRRLTVRAATPVNRTPAPLPTAQRLIGRDGDLAGLTRLLGDRDTCPHVVVLHGIPGVGKTALAVAAAHELAAEFPGGCYFLTRSTSAAEYATVLGKVMGAKRSLVVLDGVTEADQVTLPLPPDGRCVLLVTSTNRMRDLPFVTRVELRPLAEDAAFDLLGATIGTARALRSPDAVRWIVRECGGLPRILLATVRHLASRPDWDLDAYVDNIEAMHAEGDHELVNTRVRPFFEDAYTELPVQLARVFRLAGLHPAGEFSPYAIAAMADSSVHEADLALDDLVDRNLVLGTAPGRYHLHPLLRHFAACLAHVLEPPDVRDAARHRLAEYYLARLRTAVSGADGQHPGPRHEFTKPWLLEQQAQIEELLTRLPQVEPVGRDLCALLAWLHTDGDAPERDDAA